MGSKMFVYGGYGENGTLDDMWTYDTTSNEWYVPAVGSKPPARSGHATIPQSDGSILIQGGQDSAGKKLNDFWRYSSGSFQQLPDCPRAYSNHIAHMIDEDVLFVFGEPGVIAYYQFSAGMWDLLSGGPPLNGYACSAVGQNAHSGHKIIFIFGGEDASGDESDVVYEFDCATGELTQRVERMPNPLVNSARAEVNSSLFFGGISNGTIINTTLHFSVPCGCVGANYTFVCGQEVNTSCTLNCNLNSNGTCFTAGANDITINGNGYSITGNTTGSGINVTGRNNVTIKNFNVYNFSQGIYLSFSNNNITNNTASNNTGYDFYSDENSHDNTLKNLTIASYPTTISFTYNNGVGIKGVDTAPPDPADKVNINRYVNATNVTANSWLFLNVSYNASDVSVVPEESLKLWKYNGTWHEIAGVNGVNTAENYVYAHITDFSVFAPLGNPTRVTIPAATGSGDVIIETDKGYFCNETKALLTLPNRPALTFPHGFFNVTICGLNTSNPENVTINFTFPSAIPTNAEFWKYNSSTGIWNQYPFDDNDGDNVISIIITDNDATGDHNPVLGVINDPNGIGWPAPAPIPVPEFNAVGLLVLIGILSVVLAVAALRKK
ncbi:MAG: hypothetical protein J7K81_04880 [Methanophagales archaeon]|nr:hypothetical protein [Methanophagales archaeon]